MLRPRRGLASRMRRSGKYFCRIDVSALLSVIFVLSISFVVMQMSHHGSFPGHGYFPDVPKSLHARPLPDASLNDALRVSVSRDGRYFLGGTRYSLDNLATQLREGEWRGAERKVYLVADARAKYGTVKLALAEVRRGGIKDVAILTN
jgi:biopolymer transport protein TolR